jgi:hypothetical protein
MEKIGNFIILQDCSSKTKTAFNISFICEVREEREDKELFQEKGIRVFTAESNYFIKDVDVKEFLDFIK